MLITRREGAGTSEQQHLRTSGVQRSSFSVQRSAFSVQRVEFAKLVQELRPRHGVLHFVEAIENDEQAPILVELLEAAIAIAAHLIFGREQRFEQAVEARRSRDRAKLHQHRPPCCQVIERSLRLPRHELPCEATLPGSVTAKDGERRGIVGRDPSLDDRQQRQVFGRQAAVVRLAILRLPRALGYSRSSARPGRMH